MAFDERQVLQNIQKPPLDILTYASKTEIGRRYTSVLNFSNPSNSIIAFKMKSTSPHIIKAQPIHGFMKPKDNAQITITSVPVKDCQNSSIRERVSVLLAVVKQKLHSNPAEWWRSQKLDELHSVRFVFPLTFIEEGKSAVKDIKEGGQYDEKEELSIVEPTSADSSTITS